MDLIFIQALEIAIKAHRDQVDLSGEPYILHPIRLAARCSFDPILRVAAILHDVVEDSDVTLEEIDAIAGNHIEAIVNCLSRRRPEAYSAYISRIITMHEAIAIKILDLEDNMNVLRCKKVDEAMRQRLNMYLETHKKLTLYERGL